MNGDNAKAFFAYTATGYKFGDSNYGIKVDLGSKTALDFEGVATGSSIVYTEEFDKSIHAIADTDPNTHKKVVTSQTVKYSIVKQSKTKADWTDTSKVKTVAYTIIPVSKLNNRSIGTFARQEIITSNSNNANANNAVVDDITGIAGGTLAFVPNEVDWGGEDNLKIKVTGTYNGLTVTIPQSAYQLAESSEIKFKVENSDGGSWDNKEKIGAVSSGALTWNELYDEDTAKLTRIDATKTLSLVVDSDSNGEFTSTDETISRAITFSDEASKPAEIKFVFNQDEGSAETATMRPTLTKINAPNKFYHEYDSWNDNLGVMILDQYGKVYATCGEPAYDVSKWSYLADVEFSVSNIEENPAELAHVPNNFVVNANGSKTMNIEGAEIGDTFTLTATIAGTKISDSVKVTVNADIAAVLTSAAVDNSDETLPIDKNLRKILGYAR